MMRLTWITTCALLVVSPLVAQQPANQRAIGGASQARQAIQQPPAAALAQQQQAAANAAARQPFPPLTAQENAQLQQRLLAWQTVSQGTKTLDCTFVRWHYDMGAAPAGIFATKAAGVVKYAAPDKGLFRVDQLIFYQGLDENKKPKYGPIEGQFGEHWVCNGKELIEFDATKKECRVEALPPALQGTKIFNSPLPFVFNSDSAQIQQRFWVREVAAEDGVILIEAWPKRQEDRAQYKTVQIALDANTFLPKALMMFAPNFNVKTAQKFDHYEFQNMKRNGLINGIANFMGNFVPKRPPQNWQIIRSNFLAPPEMQPQPDGQLRQATRPNPNQQ